MAVTVPPEVDFLLNALVGQEWPTGDPDALRRCAQAWTDALISVAELAGHGDNTARGVGANVSSISVDEFLSYWNAYTAGGDPHLGELARQCESQAATLLRQANEVEYTQLSIIFTLILTAIQIAWAIAAAVMTMGASLTEIALAMFIGRQSVLMIAGRFVQMVLTMVVPDVITQAIMEVQGRETGWDWGKTGPAFENAAVAGLIGTFLGAGVAKLPFMSQELAATLDGKLIQGLTHFAEGGTVNATTGLITDLQYGRPLDAGRLWGQFMQGGVLATAFYLPHLAIPHGTPLSFAGADGNRYQIVLSDSVKQQFDATGHLPDGLTAPVFDGRGIKVGTATFHGPLVGFDHPVGGAPSLDLSQPGPQSGFWVGSHDGTVTRYGFPHTDTPAPSSDSTSAVSVVPKPQPLSYSQPSDGHVSIETAPTPASPDTPRGPFEVPAGSVVHFTPDGVPYRADLVDPRSGTVTVVQTAHPGDPLHITGHTVYADGPGGVGKFLGVQGTTLYGPDGSLIGSTSAITGHSSFTDPVGLASHLAFSDHYRPFSPTTTAGAHGAGPTFEAAGHAGSAGDSGPGGTSAPAPGGGPGDGTGPLGLPEPAGSARDVPEPVVVVPDMTSYARAAGAAVAARPGHGEWVTLGDQSAGETGGTPASRPGDPGGAPVYGQPDTAADVRPVIDVRGISVPDAIRALPAGQALVASRAAYDRARVALDQQYAATIADLERTTPVQVPAERDALAELRYQAAGRYIVQAEALGLKFQEEDRRLITQAISRLDQQIQQVDADLRRPSAALGKSLGPVLGPVKASLTQERQMFRAELAGLDHKYLSHLGVVARVVGDDLTTRRAWDASRAYEQAAHQLARDVSADKLPGELARLGNDYYIASTPPGIRAQREALLRDQAAIDAATSAATETEFRAWLSALDNIHTAFPGASLPSDPALRQAYLTAVDQAQQQYVRAEAHARVQAIDTRLADLRAITPNQGQDPQEARQRTERIARLVRIRGAAQAVLAGGSAGSPAGQALPAALPSELPRAFADVTGGTARGRLIDQQAAAVRAELQQISGGKVAAAGRLLLDDQPPERFGVTRAGDTSGNPARHLRTVDGTDIWYRQQQYQAPDQRLISSRAERSVDAEAHLLDNASVRLTALRQGGTEPSGVFVIGSSKLMCPSCQARLHDLAGDFPRVQVVLATDTETLGFDQHQAELRPAWVWGTRDVGQLHRLDLGLAGSSAAIAPPGLAPGTADVPLADVSRVTDLPAAELSAAGNPAGAPGQFRVLAEAMRQRAAETGRMQAVVQDAAGQLHWLEGGSRGMLSPGLADVQMSGAEPGGPAGRIVLRTSSEPVDVTDPAAMSRLSAREHRDRTIVLPPEGDPVQLAWSARLDTMRSGVFLRAHDSPADTAGGANLDAVDRQPGVENFFAHGGEAGILIGAGQEILARQAARVLPQIPEGEVWRALVCDFLDPAKAGALADGTGRAVVAADTAVAVGPKGQAVADTRDPATGQPAFAVMPGHTPEGKWGLFHPGDSPPGMLRPDDPLVPGQVAASAVQALAEGTGRNGSWFPLGGNQEHPGSPEPAPTQPTPILQALGPQAGQAPASPVTAETPAPGPHPQEITPESPSPIMTALVPGRPADEYAGLLAALQEAQQRSAAARERLALVRSQPGDYGPAAANELLARQEVTARQQAVAAWQAGHGPVPVAPDPASAKPVLVPPGTDPLTVPGAQAERLWESATFTVGRRSILLAGPNRRNWPLGGREIETDRRLALHRVTAPDGSVFLELAVELDRRTISDGATISSSALVTPQTSTTLLRTMPIGSPLDLPDLQVGQLHIPASALGSPSAYLAVGAEATGMRQVDVTRDIQGQGHRAALVVRLAGPGGDPRTGLLGGRPPVWFAGHDGTLSPGEPEREVAWTGDAYLLAGAFGSILGGAAGGFGYVVPLLVTIEVKNGEVSADVGFEVGASLAIFPSLAQLWGGTSWLVGTTLDTVLRGLGVSDPQVSAALHGAVSTVDQMLRAHGISLGGVFSDWLNVITEPENISFSVTWPLGEATRTTAAWLDAALQAALAPQGVYVDRPLSTLLDSVLTRLPHPPPAAPPAAPDAATPPRPSAPAPARAAAALPALEPTPVLTPAQEAAAQAELELALTDLPPDIRQALIETGSVESLERWHAYQAAAIQAWQAKWHALIAQQGQQARDTIEQQGLAWENKIRQHAEDEIAAIERQADEAAATAIEAMRRALEAGPARLGEPARPDADNPA